MIFGKYLEKIVFCVMICVMIVIMKKRVNNFPIELLDDVVIFVVWNQWNQHELFSTSQKKNSWEKLRSIMNLKIKITRYTSLEFAWIESFLISCFYSITKCWLVNLVPHIDINSIVRLRLLQPAVSICHCSDSFKWIHRYTMSIYAECVRILLSFLIIQLFRFVCLCSTTINILFQFTQEASKPS